ncbi:MAG: tripartite tricarboxylate transporter substrate binding protein [Deltaproteobacteria bacterium]|nr:tripartite tricarboxylate transporter substrate binding protein [Deltaproteobacteria bacterium]
MEKLTGKGKMLFLAAVLALSLAVVSSPQGVSAAPWPERNITIVVAYNPGGGFDLVARVTAPFIEKYLPKRASVIIKNVPGGGTRIGTRELAKAKPDGYTISIFDPVSLAVMEYGGKPDWLNVRKLTWLAQLDNLADMLVVGPKTGFKHPRDLKGKTVRFAGQDDATIFRSAVVAHSLGAMPVFVRYGGTGEAVMASLRGDLDALSLSWSSGMRQVKTSEDKMIPLLVSSKVPGLNVPSGKELGITVDELVMDHPHTMAGPPGMPSDVQRMWEETFVKVTKDPEWIAKMEKLGYPASPLIGKKKLDAPIAATMGRMDKYKDIIGGLTLIK